MKKILLLLMLCYSFSFSSSLLTGNGVCPNTYIKSNGWIIYKNKNQNPSMSLTQITMNNGETYQNNFNLFYSSGFYCHELTNEGNIQEHPNSPDTYYLMDYGRKVYNYTSHSPCSSGLEFNYNTLSCGTPPPTCDPVTEELINGACVCKSGYKPFYDVAGNKEGCEVDCSSSRPISNVVPLGWVSYVDTYSTEIDCQVRADLFPFKQFNFTSINPVEQPTCTHTICDVNEFTSDSCTNFQPISIPSGFIFKGVVDREVECMANVDFLNYYDYDTQNAIPNCSTKNALYCYLKASALNDDTGITPDVNNVNPDGTIPDTSVPPVDSNTTPNANNPYDGTGQTNALLGQVNSGVRGLGKILTASDEYWKIDNNNKFNSRTASDLANTNSITGSIDGLGTKLDSQNNLLQGILDKDSNSSTDMTATNDLLQQILDKNSTDGDEGGDCGFFSDLVPDSLEGVVCGDESMDDFFNDKLYDDGWYNSNSVSVSFAPSTPCYLETLSLDFGNGPVDIISEERMEIIPLDMLSNLFLSLIYLVGASMYLRES